jgi:hypothetical protein
MVSAPAVLRARGRRPFRAHRAVAVLAGCLVRPHRAALANLASMPLTVAGAACINIGVFTASVIAGWIVTGVSLVLLEHLIADEQ